MAFKLFIYAMVIVLLFLNGYIAHIGWKETKSKQILIRNLIYGLPFLIIFFTYVLLRCSYYHWTGKHRELEMYINHLKTKR